jgi:glycosyltransferase involved in cell wall biosynthesis
MVQEIYDMKKRISVVSNTSFNIVNFRLGLIKSLQNAGHSVVAIAPHDNYSDVLIQEGIDFIPLEILSRKGTNPLKDILLIKEFYKLYKKEKIDITLQYTIKPNIYGTIATIFGKTKSICTVTGLGYVFLNNNLSSKIAKILYKIAFKFANKVLFQNNDDLALFKELNLVNTKKSLVVAGSGIDTRLFNLENFTRTKNNGVHFLMIARLLVDKGIREYVAAARIVKQLHPETVFSIIGDIDLENPASIHKEELETWKREGVITFLGHKSDVRQDIANCDCVVLPSYREGLPRAILEGMAMSKPCIVSDVPGCRHTIDHEINGYLCNVKDEKNLADTIIRYINTPEEVKIKDGIKCKKKSRK